MVIITQVLLVIILRLKKQMYQPLYIHVTLEWQQKGRLNQNSKCTQLFFLKMHLTCSQNRFTHLILLIIQVFCDQQVQSAFCSFILDAIDRKGIRPIQTILNLTGVSVNPTKNFDLIAATVKMTKLLGFNTFYPIGVTPDPYNHTVNRIYVGPLQEYLSRTPM